VDNFTRCLAFTLGAEGGFTNDSADPGNWTGGAAGHGELRGTKFGISAAAYPKLDIANLTEQMAGDIYRQDYWTPLHGDELALALALVAFDAAVNAGLHRAITWLQQAAGEQTDGVLGPATLAALKSGNALSLAREALVRRLEFYSGLPTWQTFGLGWSRRTIALAGEISA
jgi:lysozyme family protein